MNIKQAKQLREGSAFWSTSRNSHDKSGYRLHVVVGVSEVGPITMDEYGYRSAWFLRPNSWAGCTLIQPAGASDPEALIEQLKQKP